jgi:hypothetical protein
MARVHTFRDENSLIKFMNDQNLAPAQVNPFNNNSQSIVVLVDNESPDVNGAYLSRNLRAVSRTTPASPVSISDAYTSVKVLLAVSPKTQAQFNGTVASQATFVSCELTDVRLAMESIVTATSVDAYLTEDAAGDRPICAPENLPIVVGRTTSTKGSAFLSRINVAVSGNLVLIGATRYVEAYLWLKTNAGTANVTDVYVTATP